MKRIFYDQLEGIVTTNKTLFSIPLWIVPGTAQEYTSTPRFGYFEAWFVDGTVRTGSPFMHKFSEN
jgi:hypothetical protein